jgi:hypothetical protein
MGRHIRISGDPHPTSTKTSAATAPDWGALTRHDYLRALNRPAWVLASLILLLPPAAILLPLAGLISAGYFIGLGVLAVAIAVSCLAVSARVIAQDRLEDRASAPPIADGRWAAKQLRAMRPTPAARHLRAGRRELQPSVPGGGLS